MPCVAIDVTNGTVTVGILPPEAIAQYASAMQPAQSVDDAMGTAQDLLSGQTGAQAQDAMQGGPEMAPAEPNPAQKDQLWTQVRNDRKAAM